MDDLQIIRKIEEKIGEQLEQLTWQEFQQLVKKKREKGYQRESEKSMAWIRKNPEKKFVLDESKNAIALWLDQSPTSINEELKQLRELKHLLLNDYQWKILNIFSSYENLLELDLGANQVNDFFFLKSLATLQFLDLNSCKINDLSPLKELYNLQSLNLSNNQISDLSPLRELHNLQCLDISNNQIKELSPLKDLHNLQYLNLSDNQIQKLSPLKNLHDLQYLDLSGNQIYELSSLKALHDLQHLDLQFNLISNLLPLKDLQKLQSLNLQQNQVSDLSPLKGLCNIQHLNLQDNHVRNLSTLKELHNLQYLNLQINQVRDLSIIVFWPQLKILQLDRNLDLQEPPKEIINQGAEAIRNYFQQMKKQGAEFLYEAKVLFVGDAAVGKTSMMNKLLDPNYQLTTTENNLSTLGIDIREYNFPWQQDTTKNFRAHFWDFGGQEVQYYIHQFFLTARSLYLLIFNDRIHSPNLDYWFRIISLLGGSKENEKSALLVVLNEKNTGGQVSSVSLPQNEYIERYADSFSEMIFRDVDLSDTSDSRLETIRIEVTKQLSKLKHIGDRLPAGWIQVRKVLEKHREQNNENYIAFSQFRKICEEAKITSEKDQLVLSSYLHDLGIILHYQHDEALFDQVFLNPHWVAKAVYVILSDKQLVRNNGHFTKKWIFEKWGTQYIQEEKNAFLVLMQKEHFDLCYKLGQKDNNYYLTPRLLSDTAPKLAHTWNYYQSLQFQYRYQFMPIGVITRVIVRLSEWILKDHKQNDVVWRNGVVLKNKGCLALIREIVSKDGVRMIDIAVNGPDKFHCRDLLTLIRSEVEVIHEKYPGIEVKKQIPCCCENCFHFADDPKMFDYETLIKYRKNGKQTIDCDRWEFILQVSVSELLEKVNHTSPENDRLELYTPANPERHLRIKREKIKRNKVFISYAQEDNEWLQKVRKHLRVLELEGIQTNLWDATQIKSGEKWREEIAKAISEAKVAILLISTDFLSSDAIIKNELPPLLQAAEKDGATILPLILENCRFQKIKALSQYQTVNDSGNVLSELSKNDQDKTLVKLTDRVEELIC